MTRISRQTLLAASVVVAVGVACGGSPVSVRAEAGPDARAVADRSAPTGTSLPSYEGVPTYEGNPGDLLSLSNLGVAEYIMYYDSYPQMRDYSDTVVVATLSKVEPISDPLPDGLLPGILHAKFAVDAIVGGREQPSLTDGLLTVTLPLSADKEIQATVLRRLEKMYGRAEYLLFLRRATPEKDAGVTYVINLDNGPPGVLAAWPGDGRLSPIQPANDLFAAAEARGEELTGTSTPVTEPPGPTYQGRSPIGLTISEVLRSFAAEVGSASTSPPRNWDKYLKLAADAARTQG